MKIKQAILAVSVATVAVKLIRNLRTIQKQKLKKKRLWTNPSYIRGDDEDIHIGEEDADVFRQSYGMNHVTFLKLLKKVENTIKRKNTLMRNSISAKLRLSVTLKYLTTGDKMKILSDRFKIPVRTLYDIIPDTCQAIFDNLKHPYLKVPSCKEDWLEIANNFECEWNYPHCLGVLNTKCVGFKLPPHQKRTNAFITGMVDAHFKFSFVDVSLDDQFRNSLLHEITTENILDFPSPNRLGPELIVPYHIIAGESFSLSPLLIRPYNKKKNKEISEEEKLFNSRFNRGLKIVENAFGLMSNNFQVLLSNVVISSEKLETIILACCALHNFLITEDKENYFQGMSTVEDTDRRTLVFPEWDKNLVTLHCNYRAKSQKEGIVLRDMVKDYFSFNIV